jgi:hypothetical protein
MIHFMIALQSLVFSAVFSPAAQADEFSHYPAKVEAITCKKLDFDSYFQAQKSKSNLLSTNPDLTHPNFGGKYLILKNELLLETRWFIVDCASGTFFHEILSGKASFKPDSLLLILLEEGNKASENDLQIWSGTDWVKVEAIEPEALATPAITSPAKTGPHENAPMAGAPALSTSPTPVPPPTFLQQYEMLFAKHPAEKTISDCKKVDFSSYFKAEKSKTTILGLNKDLTHPNYGGKYLLLKNESLLDTTYLLVDCETGKFFPESFTDSAKFKPDSLLVIVNPKGSFPKLLSWFDGQWVNLPDPVQNKKKSVSNHLTDASALTLFKSLPNPGKDSVLHFTDLECVYSGDQERGLAYAAKFEKCTVKTSHSKSEAYRLEQNPEGVAKLVEGYGSQNVIRGNPGTPVQTTYRINSGKCTSERSGSCDLESAAEETP